MATRPSRTAAPAAESDATTPPVVNTTEVPVTQETGLPAAWGTEFEEFNGHDLTDKSALVGVPFLIIGVEFERNENRGYDTAFVYALDEHGTEFEFSDSSTTGVKTQLQTYLAERDLNPAAGGGFQTIRLVIRKGLRRQDFKAMDDKTGKMKSVSTYYLSANGRAGTVENPS